MKIFNWPHSLDGMTRLAWKHKLSTRISSRPSKVIIKVLVIIEVQLSCFILSAQLLA